MIKWRDNILGGKGNIDNSGDHGVNNTGDGNEFTINNNYVSKKKGLNRTYLYDFCLEFSLIEDSSENYETEFASDIEEKMNHNEISLYKDIFYQCDHYFDDVELILEEIPKRQKILSTINFKYMRFKTFENYSSKDELCERVYYYLFETIKNDDNSQDIILEDAEFAINALMYYSFVKCKLLDPLPKLQ